MVRWLVLGTALVIALPLALILPAGASPAGVLAGADLAGGPSVARTKIHRTQHQLARSGGTPSAGLAREISPLRAMTALHRRTWPDGQLLPELMAEIVTKTGGETAALFFAYYLQYQPADPYPARKTEIECESASLGNTRQSKAE